MDGQHARPPVGVTRRPRDRTSQQVLGLKGGQRRGEGLGGRQHAGVEVQDVHALLHLYGSTEMYGDG